MDHRFFDPITILVIVGGLGLIVGCAILRQMEASQKKISVWIATGILGVLILACSTLVAVYGRGIDQARQVATGNQSSGATAIPKVASSGSSGLRVAPDAGSMPTAPSSSVPPGGMRGGMTGPTAGPAGAAGAAGGGPTATRELTALVGKLELLTKGLQVNLDSETAGKLASVLAKLDSEAEMTEEAAINHIAAITALLSPENKSAIDSIELPRRRTARASGDQGSSGPGAGGPGSGRGGGRGGGQAGPGQGGAVRVGPTGTGSIATTGVVGTSNERGGNEATDNPFKQEENAQRLHKLRQRISDSSADGKPKQGPNE